MGLRVRKLTLTGLRSLCIWLDCWDQWDCAVCMDGWVDGQMDGWMALIHRIGVLSSALSSAQLCSYPAQGLKHARGYLSGIAFFSLPCLPVSPTPFSFKHIHVVEIRSLGTRPTAPDEARGLLLGLRLI